MACKSRSAGHPVRIYDGSAAVRAKVLAGIAENVGDLKRFDLIDDADAVMARLTVTDDLAARLLRLPIYYGISDTEVDAVIDTVKAFYEARGFDQ